MKPFNLKEALEGKPVITRDGREVTQVKEFKINSDYPLRAIWEGQICSFKLSGKNFSDPSLDLFMAPIKTKYYVHVYNWSSRKEVVLASNPTKDETFIAHPEAKLIKTLEFEIDEWL